MARKRIQLSPNLIRARRAVKKLKPAITSPAFRKLLNLADQIAYCRKHGASYAAIAKVLCEHGIRVSAPTVWRFSVTHLSEPTTTDTPKQKP